MTAQPLFFPDFDLSLRRYGISDKDFYYLLIEKEFRNHPPLFANREDIPYYRKFKDDLKTNYERILKIPPVKAGSSPLIPRIVHQIWMGGPPPERLEVAIKSWLGWQGWEYKLWNDYNIQSLNLRNADIIAATTNLGERSDMLRYEILYQQGGLYVDMDCICLKPNFFEFAHLNYDFYAGMEPIETANFRISCCNAMIGSAPGHPIMDALISKLPENINKYPNSSKKTWYRTGPIYFSKIISEHLNSDHHKNMIVPPTVFYPIGFHDTTLPVAKIMKLFKKESVAMHMWEGKWKEDSSS